MHRLRTDGKSKMVLSSRAMTMLTAGVLGAAALAGILTAMQMSVATPELTPLVRFYVSLIGALIGWSISGFALLAALYSKPEHPPTFVMLVFGVGASQVLIFNEFLIADDAVSVVFKVLGYLVIVSSVVGVLLYRHGYHEGRQDTE